jgi:hypothetical protein
MHLSDYIKGLIDALGAANPAALAPMRAIVGAGKARIIVDDERADVWFKGETLRVLGSSHRRSVNGSGQTDSRTVLDLLNGYLDVNEAILIGSLEHWVMPTTSAGFSSQSTSSSMRRHARPSCTRGAQLRSRSRNTSGEMERPITGEGLRSLR